MKWIMQYKVRTEVRVKKSDTSAYARYCLMFLGGVAYLLNTGNISAD